MASIPKLLMDEFYSMERAALAESNYGAAQVFSSCESMVNNLLHGRHPAEVLGRCRKIFEENAQNERFEEGSRAAYAEAVIVVDLFAEQYGLELTTEATS